MPAFKLLLALLLQPVFFAGNAQRTIFDPHAEVRVVPPFNAITVSGAVDVFISQDPQTAVAVSAGDSKLTGRITTEVINGTLVIGYQSNSMSWDSKGLKAYISLPQLSRVKASGSCDVLIEGDFKTDALEILLSGSSDFKGMLHLETLRVDAAGSSDIYLQGHAAAARIRLTGSSDVKSFDFDADVVDIDASGSSDVNITANKELRVKASGSSDVIYKGNALVTKVNTSGSSELSKKN